jgi:hypothetical protein
MYWTHVAQERGTVEDFCERGKEPSGSIKFWEIIEELSD